MVKKKVIWWKEIIKQLFNLERGVIINLYNYLVSLFCIVFMIVLMELDLKTISQFEILVWGFMLFIMLIILINYFNKLEGFFMIVGIISLFQILYIQGIEFNFFKVGTWILAFFLFILMYEYIYYLFNKKSLIEKVIKY